MDFAHRWEGTSKEILAMEIQNLHLKKKSAIKYYGFREIEVYGTIFSYLGYMANASYTDRRCLPYFVFDTRHNANEKTKENE